jgi:hypothetical protein
MNFAFSVLAGSLWLLALPCFGQKAGSRSTLGEAYARQQVQRVIKAAPKAPFYKPLLPTKVVAIAVVEPLLFSIYGKEQIIQQRPYEAYLINGVWYLAGTLPQDMDGGTFEIMVEAKNGRVMELTHGK